MRFAIIGMGRIGSSLYFSLKETDFEFTGYYSRRLEEKIERKYFKSIKELDADVYFFTVPDNLIYSLKEMIEKDNKYFVHCSGYLSSDILGNKRILSLHPMISVGRKFSSLKNISWGIEGDEEGLKIGEKIIKVLNGRYYVIKKEDKPLYHCSCVISANLVNTLLYYSSEIMKGFGIEEKDVLNLASSVINNSEDLGILNSLTGPVERGDFNTIEGELLALKNKYPYIFYSILQLFVLNAQLSIKKGRDEKDIIDFVNRISSLRE